MESRIGLPLLLVLMVTFAGCAGFSGGTTPDTTSTTTPPSTTTDQPSQVSMSEAKQRALNAENNRVTQILENASTISGSSVGVYGETKATAVNQSSTSIEVRVKMSYSYEYHCENKSGAVDGLSTTARYQISPNTTELIEVIDGVRMVCENPQEAQPSAVDRAVSAEKQRIEARLANISNATGSVGVYGTIETTVINQSDTGSYVRVKMPYSYEYSCDGSSGAVDGLKTNVVYRVTPSEVTVVRITEDIRNACA
ncbi:hypothetical protein [Halospeciosus flavus]|uniref:Lipoprotein n=1 Tax=Halospeciosus flavus TaxID=3032283 RepID=A0ABD5YX93_9EURY